MTSGSARAPEKDTPGWGIGLGQIHVVRQHQQPFDRFVPVLRFRSDGVGDPLLRVR